MAETVTENQVNEAVNEQANGGATFTQEQVNGFIQERLKKERAKYSDYDSLKEKASKFDEIEESNKSELQKANEKATELQAQIDRLTKEKELNEARTKVASEKGVPASLLTGDSEEACTAQADAILKFAQSKGYPTVKDGGENTKINKGNGVAGDFESWFNSVLS